MEDMEEEPCSCSYCKFEKEKDDASTVKRDDESQQQKQSAFRNFVR